MKKLYSYALAGVLSLAAMPAFADNGEMTVVPTPDTYMELISSFTITFDDYKTAVPKQSIFGPNEVTHCLYEGEPIEGTHYVAGMPSPNPDLVNNTVTLNIYVDFGTQKYKDEHFGVGQAEGDPEGLYTIVLDAGVIELTDAAGNTFTNEEISINYHLGAPTYSTATIEFVDTPTGTVDEFQSITFKVNPTPEELIITDSYGYAFNLLRNGASVATFDGKVNDDKSVTLTLQEPYVKAGKYQVSIAANALLIDLMPNTAASSTQFEISGDKVVKQIVYNPEPDSYVDEFTELNIFFDNYDSVTVPNADEPGALVATLTKPNGENVYMTCVPGPQNGFSYSFVEASGSSWGEVDDDATGDGAAWTTFTEEGQYVLNIPAGFFTIEGQAGEAMTLNYFIGEAPAPVETPLYVVGSMTEWGINADYKFTFENDAYTLKLDELDGEFKITTANAEGNCDWEAVNFGGDYTLEEGGYSLEWNGKNLTAHMTDVTLTAVYDADNKTMGLTVAGTVKAEEPVVIGDLYLVGDKTDWTLKAEYKLTKDGDKYTYTGSELTGKFKVAGEPLWTGVNLGAAEAQNLGFGEVELVNNGQDITFTEAGEVIITVTVAEDGKSGNLTIAKADDGVESLATDTANAEYFNLQGIRISEPAAGQLYIVRRGSSVSKEIYRK